MEWEHIGPWVQAAFFAILGTSLTLAGKLWSSLREEMRTIRERIDAIEDRERDALIRAADRARAPSRGRGE